MPKAPAKDYEESSKICIGCGQPADFSILLAGSPGRWYLPNQNARMIESPPLSEVWFCRVCMRVIEEALRDTIKGLRH